MQAMEPLPALCKPAVICSAHRLASVVLAVPLAVVLTIVLGTVLAIVLALLLA